MRRLQALRSLRGVFKLRGIFIFMKSRATYAHQIDCGARRNERLWRFWLRDVKGFERYVVRLHDGSYS